jgi:hypothetical protein
MKRIALLLLFLSQLFAVLTCSGPPDQTNQAAGNNDRQVNSRLDPYSKYDNSSRSTVTPAPVTGNQQPRASGPQPENSEPRRSNQSSAQASPSPPPNNNHFGGATNVVTPASGSPNNSVSPSSSSSAIAANVHPPQGGRPGSVTSVNRSSSMNANAQRPSKVIPRRHVMLPPSNSP